MPSREAKCRKCIKEYYEANKHKISADTTSYSKEHGRTEYHRDYAGNLVLSLCYLLTSVTTRPLLRRAIGSLPHGPWPVTIRPLRRGLLNLLHSPRPVIVWTLGRELY